MSATQTELIPGDYQFRALHEGPRVQRFWHRNKLQVLRRVLADRAFGTIVDVGCGSGNLLLFGGLSARLAIGLDASRDAVRFAHDQVGDRPIRFVQAGGGAIPLGGAVADLVLLVEVIEHLTDPGAILREIRRVLKPGGHLFLTTPNYGWPSPWPALEWLADHSGRVAKMRDAQHVQRFTTASLRATLEQERLRVRKLGTFYGFSPLLAAVSEPWGDRAVGRELARDIGYGSLLYCLADRSPD
jgi:2-polyprenyl-3-methyl-5-hydroxy-6-metoxy-1,4-benzoquinol methylase